MDEIHLKVFKLSEKKAEVTEIFTDLVVYEFTNNYWRRNVSDIGND